MSRRILVLANPIAGGGRARSLAPLLVSHLERHGCTALLHFTGQQGDACARAQQAGSEQWDALVAIGGDGTVNEVLNGMPDPTRPIGVLPLGTANVLACELGLPRDPAAAAAAIAVGREQQLAIGTANGRRFLLFCGSGVDGDVVRRLHGGSSRSIGKRKWLRPVLGTTWHWPRFRLRATFDDGMVLEDLSEVLVTRVRNYGGLLRMVPEIDHGSGLLHAVCFRGRSRVFFMWQGLRGFLGCMRTGKHLLHRTATRIRIEGEAPFQIDGEAGGSGNVELALLPQQARLLVPA